MSHSNWHTRALAFLDADHADTVLLELLKEPEYERDAAMTLLQLARTPEPQSPVNPLGRKKDYNEMWKARTTSQVTGFNEQRRTRYASAIRAELESLLEAGKEGQSVNDFRVKELAKILAVFDARGGADLIFRALQISGRFNSWQITFIAARSPQAKGRVERLWGVLQDRLRSELRLAQACDLDSANQVLARFLAAYNRRFARRPREMQTAWRPAPPDLDRICCFLHQRVVSNDNIVQWQGQRFQIPQQGRRFSFAGAKVQIYQTLDGRVSLYYGDTRLEHTLAPPG
jgi:hypothetical protein